MGAFEFTLDVFQIPFTGKNLPGEELSVTSPCYLVQVGTFYHALN